MFGVTERSSMALTPPRDAEVEAKLALLRGLLDRRSLAAVALTSVDSVAWLADGLTCRIEPGNPASPVWFVVTPNTAAAVTNDVERPRLEVEPGLPELGIELL